MEVKIACGQRWPGIEPGDLGLQPVTYQDGDSLNQFLHLLKGTHRTFQLVLLLRIKEDCIESTALARCGPGY